MSLSELCANMAISGTSTLGYYDKDIMEFVEAPWGLGLGCSSDVPPLYPVQRFILKGYYGL